MASVYRPFPEKLGGQSATSFVGNQGDLFYDPTTATLRVSDGSTAGGVVVGAGGTIITDSTRKIYTDNHIRFTGNILPTAHNTYDIGSASYKIRDIYEDDSSDIRLKENITPFTEGLSFLNNLDVVTFSWNEKSPKHGEQETGLIAQNVKETLDNSNYQSQKLWYEGPDSYQGLDKKHLIPALVAAVQELSAKVKELEDKV